MSDDNGEAAAGQSGATPADLLAEVRTLLDEVREAILDTASGDVVGALWDEFRSARTSLDSLVQSTTVIEELAQVRADVAALRSELSEGLVVEPSDALADTVDQLRTDLGGLDARMATLAELNGTVGELQIGIGAAVADQGASLQAFIVDELASLPRR